MTLDDDQELDRVIESLLETCDCAACERLRRAERRKWLIPLYRERIARMVAGGAR